MVGIFENREHAGELLATEISKLKLSLENLIIAAIPRGGIVVGAAVSQKLGVPLSVLVVKKLGAPGNPELAIGATASYGAPVLDRWLIADLDVSRDYLKKEIIKKRKEAASRESFLGIKLTADTFSGRVVIVVDDGIATGQTARAAAKIIRKFGPLKLILAVGCASPTVIDQLKGEYDEIICPIISEELFAVGQFYRDFRPISDEEAKQLLATSH